MHQFMFTNIFKSHLPSILGTIIHIKFHFKQKEERKFFDKHSLSFSHSSTTNTTSQELSFPRIEKTFLVTLSLVVI